MSLSRRRFVAGSLAAGAFVATGRLRAEEKPAERLGLAVVGLGGRGHEHINQFMLSKQCQLLYVCDPDRERGEKCVATCQKKYDVRPTFVEDLRTLLDDKRVDIVSIAAANHWHALASIWAIQAGKDVYCEKPVSHNLVEGRRMVQAARKHGRILQAGTQYRSGGSNLAAAALIREGKLGKIRYAHTYTYRLRKPIGPAGDYPVPASVNYDLWAGPAPAGTVRRQQFHYDWHWFWDYGNGEIGNNSVHAVDAMRLMTGLDGLGRSVLSFGGRLGFHDAAETPNTQVTVHDVDGTIVVQEVRNFKTKEPAIGPRILIVGDEGMIGGSLPANNLYDPDGTLVRKIEGPGDNHFINFLAAVRSRRHEDLRADILQGHYSTGLTQLANVSQRLGRPAAVAEIRARLETLPMAERLLATLAAIEGHLADNGVRLDQEPMSLGPRLEFDAAREQFADAAANALLGRTYRKGYELPAADAL